MATARCRSAIKTDTEASPLATSTDAIHSDCLKVDQECVPYVWSGESKKYKKLVLGLAGLTTSSRDFNAALNTATSSSYCLSDTLIICPDFIKSSPYNMIAKPVVGNLTLETIMDAFVEKFKPSTGKVAVAGFSKGGQGVQRYSLVSTMIDRKVDFIYGCASDFAFLDPTIDFKYGLANFPSIYNASMVIPNLKKAGSFLVACGNEDSKKPSVDTDLAQAQGATRTERAQNLVEDYKLKGISQISYRGIPNVGHDDVGVMSVQGDFICK